MNDGVIPKEAAEGLLISLQVFIHPEADSNTAIFQTQYEAAYQAIENAMTNAQTVDKMLANRTTSVHGLCTVGEGDAAAPIAADEVQKLIDAVHVKEVAIDKT